jgi:choline dehydrogenase
MLPREDGGVVDYRFKVYGVTNLRVVDASVFPLHFAAHPQASIYGLTERVCLYPPEEHLLLLIATRVG